MINKNSDSFIKDWHPNIWPPFTQIKTNKAQIEVSHGKDASLFTTNPERELIDGISSWWVTLHGHSNDFIANAISDQAKKLEQVIFADFLHPQAKKLAERLSRLTKLERLFVQVLELVLLFLLQYIHCYGHEVLPTNYLFHQLILDWNFLCILLHL